jgi:uncharacterized membrane protein
VGEGGEVEVGQVVHDVLAHGVISVEQTKVSVQQNSTIEQLTILATVFLPLTFVTGFFGQNFGWLVRHQDSLAAFAIYGIGGLVVPLALLFVWLRRRAAHTGTAGALHDNSSRTRSGRRPAAVPVRTG